MLIKTPFFFRRLEITIDHFIIMARRPGYTYPSCIAHHKATRGTNGFYYIDRTQYKVPGWVDFYVSVVYTNFKKLEPVRIGGTLVS